MMRVKHITIAVLLFVSSLALAENGKIAGTVVDEYGDAVIGSTVQIEETSQGIQVMSIDGSFTILGVEPDKYTVCVNSIGYGSQTFKNVLVQGGLCTTLNVVLYEEALQGQEVFIEYVRPAIILEDSKQISRSLN